MVKYRGGTLRTSCRIGTEYHDVNEMEIGSIGHAGPSHIMGISTELGIFSRTLVNFSKVLHTSIHAWEYPASLLNDNFIDPEIQNWPGEYLLGQANTWVPIKILSLATGCYGGLHAAAWHAYSPISLKQQCWRFLAMYITVSGAIWGMVSLMYHSISIHGRSEAS